MLAALYFKETSDWKIANIYYFIVNIIDDM